MTAGTSTSRPAPWRWVVGLAVLLVLGATCAAALATRAQTRDTQHDRLAYEARQLDAALAERMQAYVQVLWGGVGLILASRDVSRDEWVDYVDTLGIRERYPGFKSLSFAPAVPDDELDAFVEEVRRQPVPPGTVDPALLRRYTPRSPTGVPGRTEIHSPILFVAPYSPENQAVLGVDMMQDPTRREVMLDAADAGAARLSPRLRLATQDDQRAGFIAYLPIHRGEELVGWLTAAFRADDFMRGLLGEFASTVDFEIADGAGGLLYSTHPADDSGAPVALDPETDLRRTTEVEMPGRAWEVHYVANDSFATPTERAAPWVVLGGGLLVTLLVGAVGVTGGGWRRRAREIDDQRVALVEREAVIRHQAAHDPLTGLANRSHFMDTLGAAIDAGPVGIVYVDMDGFKPVNDRFGHRAGDALLVEVAARMSRTVRPADTVARLGGDEFAVVVPEAGGAGRVEESARALVAALGDPYDLDVDGARQRVVLSASAGIASYPADAADADGLVHAADTAMFAAKRDGGGRFRAA